MNKAFNKLTLTVLLALLLLEVPAAQAEDTDISRISDLIGSPQTVGIGEKVFRNPPSFFNDTADNTTSKSNIDNFTQSELLGQGAPTLGTPVRGNASGGPGLRINGIRVNNSPASNPNQSPIPTTPTSNITNSGNTGNTSTPGTTSDTVSSPAPRALQQQEQPNGTATTAPTAAPNTPTSSSTEAMAPITLASSAPPDHEANKTVNLNPLYLSSIIEMHSFDALREESKYSQSISLQEAIRYVLDHGMAIKISRESMNYQHWLTVSAVGGFLPTFAMSYNASNVNVPNLNTTSIAHTFLSGVSFPVFQGGGVMYGLLAQRYREKAWQYTYKSTVSDVFLDVYTKYTNLVLQRVLMQIWAKTVEADEQALSNAKIQLQAGTGTTYAILQAETRLAADRQNFLQQGIAMRQAGLQLNLAMNFPLEVNLIPVEETLTEAPLFNPNVKLNTLVGDAMRFNPGLRQYEYFRLTANRQIQATASNLYPSISFFTLYQQNDTGVAPAANSAALGGAASASIASFLDSSFAGRVSNNALGQQYTFSPTSGSTSTQGANTAPAALPASSGGTPIAQIQSGSLVSSGAVAPSITGGGTGNSSGSNQNGSLQAPAGIFAGKFREVQSGFQLTWSLPNSGMTTAASLFAIKTLARQALMQCNQEISLVVENVHSDYLAMLSAREVIDKAAASVSAFRETLRLAKVSLDNGVGTYLDVMTAQTNYVQAVTAQAQAIVASNVAQAQLLHDMGMISATTLTTGYKPGTFAQPIPNVQSRLKKP
ncbi:MAG: TolC family protein [Candidatus Obscuribacterales bacterium]|nr:TolC family protein [Candidatus Obscuribacterales bacterium]